MLEIDRDLASGLPADQRALAARYALAPLAEIPPGSWSPSRGAGHRLGYLVLDGLLIREVTLGRRTTSELVGAGDLLRPGDLDTVGAQLSMQWSWTALERVRLAVLDHRFAAVIARWPTLVDALLARALRRSRALAFQLSLTQVKRVEDRIELLLWGLAERWGRVGPRGVVVATPLTHQALAAMIGARRPTVTTAIGRLTRARKLERVPQGWMLIGDAPPNWTSDV